MKSLIILLLLTIGQSVLAQDALDELIAVPLTYPGERGILEIDVVNGSIDVEGYDGKEVIIKAVSQANKKDNDHNRHRRPDKAAEGMKRISANSIEIEVTERDNNVEVESNSWNQGIDFLIQVPVDFDLKLSTVNQGDISVNGVNGSLELNNVNGEVVAENISGSAIIDTVNGKIKTSFNSVSDDEPMAFTTLNGNVDITLPASVKATFKMKSDQGEIYSDFDMDVSKSGPQVDKSRKGGFKVTIENWVYGDINGGGPEFLLNNMNGNIYIRKK